MIDETIEAFDTSPRREFTSSRLANLFFTSICLGHSGYLINFCPDLQWPLWQYFMFFGSLIWMVFLLLTSVVQFRNPETRSLINNLDWVFFLFHLIMFIWGNINCHYGTSKVDAENFWKEVYLVIGYLAVVCVFCMLFMNIVRVMNRKKIERENPEMLDLTQNHEYVKQNDKI